MVKNVIANFHKRFIAVLLIVSIVFAGFPSPAYAASLDEVIVDTAKNAAGWVVGSAAVCAGTVVFFPGLAPFACFGASAEVALARFTPRFVFSR
jgi:hypothetical protein